MDNINIARYVVNDVRTSLGLKCMDKMISSASGGVIITNDGATILNKMELVELSKSQDIVARNGTTTVVVVTDAQLKQCQTLLHAVSASLLDLRPPQLSTCFLCKKYRDGQSKGDKCAPEDYRKLAPAITIYWKWMHGDNFKIGAGVLDKDYQGYLDQENAIDGKTNDEDFVGKVNKDENVIHRGLAWFFRLTMKLMIITRSMVGEKVLV
ncbi:hypothetical protein LguiB_002147 [Lonicera macranthoides]